MNTIRLLTSRFLLKLLVILAFLALLVPLSALAGMGGDWVHIGDDIQDARDAFDRHERKLMKTPPDKSSKGDDMAQAWNLDGGCVVIRLSKGPESDQHGVPASVKARRYVG
ncbi:MAG: hypothetical protein ACAI35_10960 [Candidatus Methylacidiphilales bacterium]